MIDMNSIVTVCFDFDYTLCLWGQDGNVDYEDRKLRTLRGENFYSSSTLDSGDRFYKPSQIMKDFINQYCKNKSLYLISATAPWIAPMKIDWASKEYGVDFKNACVSHSEQKADMLRAIAEAENCPPEQILFIDDYVDVCLFPAYDAGFSTAAPIQIAEMLYNRV